MTNYSILGCDQLKAAVFTQQTVEKRFCGLGNCPTGWSQTDVRFTDVSVCVDIATFQHLGFDVSHFDVARFVSDGAAIAVDYFCGSYLETDKPSAYIMRKTKGNKSLSWFEVYRNGLLLSFLSQNVDGQRKLVNWIEPWLPFDESSFLLTVYDNDFHKLLAEFIRSGEIHSKKLESGFEKCRPQRPKLLLACLKSIRQHDANLVGTQLQKFLDYYLKNEFGTSGIQTHFSSEGSILWHVARRAGLESAGLTDKQIALIMTRESLGLTG